MSRPGGCSQPRELWFSDILMYMYSVLPSIVFVDPTTYCMYSVCTCTVYVYIHIHSITDPLVCTYTCTCIYMHVRIHAIQILYLISLRLFYHHMVGTLQVHLHVQVA